MKPAIRTKILECIETALSQGYHLRDVHSARNPTDSFFKDAYGGCCVVGAVGVGAGVTDVDIDAFGFYEPIKAFVGVSDLAIRALECGFEGYPCFYRYEDFYDLGKYIRNTYM